MREIVKEKKKRAETPISCLIKHDAHRAYIFDRKCPQSRQEETEGGRGLENSRVRREDEAEEKQGANVVRDTVINVTSSSQSTTAPLTALGNSAVAAAGEVLHPSPTF